MTINQALNISLSGLNANQKALTVVSHNISNMNTEGYAKQRVNFAEMRIGSETNTIEGQIRSLAGVTISGIKDYSNEYLNSYYRSQLSPYAATEEAAEIATSLSQMLDELSGAGLGDSLSEFYAAANTLNQNPTDSSARINYVQQAKNVALKFNSMSSNLANFETSLVGDGVSDSSARNSQAGDLVSQVNSKLSALAEMNKEMSTSPNDTSLKSQRDKILSDLSGMINIETSYNDAGTINLSIGGVNLVQGAEVMGSLKISASNDATKPPATISIIDKDGNEKYSSINDKITGGSLGGIFSSINSTTEYSIQQAKTDLNTLANAFAGMLNDIQTYDDGGVEQAKAYNRENDTLFHTDEALFVTSDGSTTINAANIKVNDLMFTGTTVNIGGDDYEINGYDLVSAARVPVGETEAVGNSDNMIEVINSRTTKIGSLGSLTSEDFIISMSSKAALSADSLSKNAETQGSILDSIKNQILSETGVNLDEELADMIKYQRAYQASARVFSACSEVLETLVSLGA